MVDKGWIPKTDNKIQLVQHLLMFFGVASPRSWNDIWEGAQISFRQSATLRSDPGAVAVWLRKGELEALNVPADEFDSNRFKHALKSIRGMTRELPRDFASVVMAECGKAGVRVVFVPELPNTCTWGATRWLSQSNALIQLSLRYKTDDHLWSVCAVVRFPPSVP